MSATSKSYSSLDWYLKNKGVRDALTRSYSYVVTCISTSKLILKGTLRERTQEKNPVQFTLWSDQKIIKMMLMMMMNLSEERSDYWHDYVTSQRFTLFCDEMVACSVFALTQTRYFDLVHLTSLDLEPIDEKTFVTDLNSHHAPQFSSFISRWKESKLKLAVLQYHVSTSVQRRQYECLRVSRRDLGKEKNKLGWNLLGS